MRSVFISGLLALAAEAAFAQGVITRLAGADWLFPGNGAPAINAPLSGAEGLSIALDNQGNYYIADPGNLMVMRVGQDGILNVVAGNGVFLASGDGGLAVNAAVFQPTAVAVDSNGIIYIAEFGSRIRKVTPDGLISTFAGTGDNGYSGDNGPALNARLSSPFGLAADAAGNIYISDTYNNCIRKISTSGIITTVAGNGKPGSTGDGGSALAAELYQPTRLAVDSSGNIYFVETVNPANVPRVRKVDIHGNISTVAGGGLNFSDGIPATQAAMIPLAVAPDTAGNLYIIDSFNQGIRKVDTKGIITTIAGGSGVFGFGGDGGQATKATFAFQLLPSIAVDSAGDIYVDDEANDRIRKIGANGLVNTVAGNGQYRLSGNGGPAVSATLDYPIGIIGDAAGNLYVSEQLQSRIRKIAPNGIISIYAGNGHQGSSGDGGPATAASIAFPGYMAIAPGYGFLAFSDTVNCKIRYIDTSGMIHTYAGNGTCVDSGDQGSALQAGLRGPSGIEFDRLDNLYFSEPNSHIVRAVLAPPDGRILTLAGTGKPGYTGDHGPANNAQLNGPVGLRYFAGSLYICDSGNNVIRRIDGSLTITTVVGTGKKGYFGDGGPAAAAWLNNPQSVGFDSNGNMFIADEGNRVIRVVTTDGNIHTFAGSTKAQTENDGSLSTSAGLGAVLDLFVNSAGDLIFTDSFYDRVRTVLSTPPSFQINTNSLSFTGPAGSAAQTQNLAVVGSIPGIPFTVSGGSDWLTISPTSGNMPASLQISVDPSKLPAGPYSASVTINAPNTVPSTQSVKVALTATAAGDPSLNVRPNAANFSFVKGAGARSQALTVSNAGGGTLSFTATAAGGNWLSVSPASGTANAFSSTAVTITADPSKLAVATYSGTVTISSSNPPETVSIPVTITVTAVQQTILIPQTGLTFFAVQGGGSPPPQNFNILNTGQGSMPYTTTASSVTGLSWPSSFPASGASDANTSAVPQVRVDANPKGLNAGVFYGRVEVDAPSADNNPQNVSVIFNVLKPGSKIGPIVQPTGLIFAGVAGGEAPGSQTILVQNTDSASVTFHAGRSSANGAQFTALPADATVTENQPVRVVIQPQATGLAAGVYRGALTFAFSDGSTRTVALVLVMVPAGTAVPSARLVPEASSSCIPKTLAPVFTQLSSGFSVPAGFPGQVAVQVVDDCANPISAGEVRVDFSNGDSSLELTSLKNGMWAGTWNPAFPAAQVTVTATALSPNGLKGTTSVKGSLQTVSQSPLISSGAIVNGASFAAAAPLAPGSLISVFGSNLATSKSSASTLPLPTDLGGSKIVLAGQQAPLLFASDGQVNAVLPYGTAANAAQQLIVLRGGALSVPQAVTVAPVAPGIFTADGSGKGQGLAFLGNSRTVADPSHPAKAGDVVVIFCTGLGEVNPAVPNGAPAPSDPPANAVNTVSVSIGGKTAQVMFAGLTPGLVGVYQVNAVVPMGVAGDAVPLFISSIGQQSPTVTIAVKQ